MKIEDVRTIAVLGAGTMGHAIAQVCAQNGFQVKLEDIKEEMVRGAMERIRKFLQGSVEREKMTGEEADVVLSRIKGTVDLSEAVKDAELVIEAVVEDIEAKKELFRRVDEISKSEAVLASNTSVLSITEMASVTARPEKVVGMHFSNPAQLMKPVEIVRGISTSDDTVELIKRLTLRMGKTPIVVKDSPGFASSRLGLALFLEASKMLEEGVASVKDIDMGAKLFYGHRMGPFETSDLVGLDARLNNLNAMYQATGDPRWRAPVLLKQLVVSGYLGKKPQSKGGYYTYFELEQ
jgi:3-hydroxybutyryl-CoA dehydrogenase